MKTVEGRLLSILWIVCMTTQATTVTSQALLTSRGKQAGHPHSQHERQMLIKATLEEYSGTFDFADFPSMAIYVSNGELYAETDRGKSVLKKATQKDRFEMVDYQATLQFKRDNHSKIISVELDAQGFTSTGTKRKTTD